MTSLGGSRVGARLGPYELLSFLGAGGMGEVYRARDPRLSRDVAVKLLPPHYASDPERMRRFEQEARAAGSLNHPNVLTVHDVGIDAGTPYVVSELLEGETLRSRLQHGPPPARKTIELAREICEGLAAAHDRGIVHRDLKPENLFLTRAGHAKILDFGLAKLRAAPAENESTGTVSAASTQEQTRAGVVLGTIGYMSPEQIRGDALDARSDIFALGSLLHEMLSGRRPFRGPTSAETMHAILHEDPPALDEKVGPGLERIVRRCLEKRPDERFQSARDVAFALEAVSGGSAPVQASERGGRPRRPQVPVRAATIVVIGVAGVLAYWLATGRRPPAQHTDGSAPVRSIAVLPFQPRGVVAGLEHLGVALPDEIATVLTYAPGLAVRSFTDSSRYAGQDLDVARVGRELGVQNLVVGNYGREGGELRFSVEAIELTNNRLLWRDTWTVVPTQLKSLRDTVRERVSAGLLPALGQARGLLAGARRGPASDESYELYLRAAGLTNGEGPNKEALRLLERATVLDPDFALAWSELARRLSWDSTFFDGGETGRERAALAVDRATALDPDLLPAAVFKIVRNANEGRVAEAYRSAEELVRRRPDSAQAHFARNYALRYGGSIAEAARECRLARSLDPSDPGLWSCEWTFLHLRDYEQAESFAELGRARQPELHVGILADIWTRKGDRAAARRAMIGFPDTFLGADVQRACLEEPRPAHVADLVKRDLARIATYLNDSEGLYWYGALMADCGFAEASLRFLAKSIDDGYCSSVALDNDTLWNSVRQLPEFRRLRERARECHARFVAETGAPS